MQRNDDSCSVKSMNNGISEKNDTDSFFGNETIINDAIDLSCVDINFLAKPILVGGLAMEYYGLRKCGDDIDLIISEEDYKRLAYKYPDNRVDTWGDLSVDIGRYSFLRSISRLDYSFYIKNAIEYEKCKVVSFERLFFMTAAAIRSEPDAKKRIDDFGLALGHYYDCYRNKEYVANAELNAEIYNNAPDGTIYAGKYSS